MSQQEIIYMYITIMNDTLAEEDGFLVTCRGIWSHRDSATRRIT